MTREEEIIKGMYEICEQINDTFVAGAKWADEHPKNPWISVKDRLPEDDELFEYVAVYMDKEKNNVYDHQWYQGYYTGDVWYYIDECGDHIRTFDVTHWMPLQEPNENVL